MASLPPDTKTLRDLPYDIRKLLPKKWDLDTPVNGVIDKETGDTPLIGTIDLHRDDTSRIAIFKSLLENGAAPNTPNFSVRTPVVKLIGDGKREFDPGFLELLIKQDPSILLEKQENKTLFDRIALIQDFGVGQPPHLSKLNDEDLDYGFIPGYHLNNPNFLVAIIARLLYEREVSSVCETGSSLLLSYRSKTEPTIMNKGVTTIFSDYVSPSAEQFAKYSTEQRTPEFWGIIIKYGKLISDKHKAQLLKEEQKARNKKLHLEIDDLKRTVVSQTTIIAQLGDTIRQQAASLAKLNTEMTECHSFMKNASAGTVTPMFAAAITSKKGDEPVIASKQNTAASTSVALVQNTIPIVGKKNKRKQKNNSAKK